MSRNVGRKSPSGQRNIREEKRPTTNILLYNLENQPDIAYIRKKLMNVKYLDIPGAVGSHVCVIGVRCKHRELISIPIAVVSGNAQTFM
jgi:hypothetical protein